MTLALHGCDSSPTTSPEVVLEGAAGDGQAATVGQALAEPLVVRAVDAGGVPLEGVTVEFSVVGGGGSVEPAIRVTGDDGRAAVSWTLGTRTDAVHRVRATVEGQGGSGSAEFGATASAGPAEGIEVLTGDDQRGQHLAPLPRSLAVRVTDEFGNPVSGETVRFTVESGGGSLEPGTASTDEAGATRASWTLGPPLGQQTATASATDLPPVSFSATALEDPYVGVVLHSVFGDDIEGVLRLDDPGSDPGAPALEVRGAETAVQGGGAVLNISAGRDFSTLYVFVDGHDGYLELDVTAIDPASEEPSGEVLYELAATFEEFLLEEEYELTFAAGTGDGAGIRAPLHFTVHPVTVGPIQVSVAWDVPSDVDLYLVEPSGDTIHYNRSPSESGGVLELDSNAVCVGEDLRNESITWPERTPAIGTYAVRLNYWSSCEQERTRWLVVVRVEGEVVRVEEGVFTGDGGFSGEAVGEQVTTFTF